MSAAEAWVMIEGSARTPFEPSAVDDAVLQLYTPGTTGNPKGAVLSNRNLFALRKHSRTLDMPYTKWEDEEAVRVAMSSEERRVGKECVRPWRSGWAA